MQHRPNHRLARPLLATCRAFWRLGCQARSVQMQPRHRITECVVVPFTQLLVEILHGLAQLGSLPAAKNILKTHLTYALVYARPVHSCPLSTGQLGPDIPRASDIDRSICCGMPELMVSLAPRQADGSPFWEMSVSKVGLSGVGRTVATRFGGRP